MHVSIHDFIGIFFTAMMNDADMVEADNVYRRGKQALLQSLDGDEGRDLPRVPGWDPIACFHVTSSFSKILNSNPSEV